VGECALDGFGGLAGMVLRDGTIDVVGDVGGANAVVQPVDQWRVRPVDGEECAAHVREGVIVEMRHIHISVLQPCVPTGLLSHTMTLHSHTFS